METRVDAAEPNVALVRGPIVATTGSINNEATPAIGLAYLAGYIRARGWDVAIVDAIGEGLDRFWPIAEHPGHMAQGLTLEETVARIPAGVGVIGVSAMFSGEWPVVRRLIGLIHGRFPEAVLVAGGEHATALPEYVLREQPALDLVVRGEGEATFHAVLEARRDGRGFDGIGGLAFLDGEGRYVEPGGLPRLREIGALAWPWWPEGYLERFWAFGKSYGVATARDMPMLASRGCPYRCSFCSSPGMWTTRYVLRDIDDLVAEIKHWQARYGITALQFYDLTAITKKRWTVAFCKALIENGIALDWSLPSGTRSEALDAETLALLKRTGCTYLVYAPESGSPATLERIRKRIRLKDFTASVLEARRQGLVLRTNLIIGFPHETRADVMRTIRYGLYLALRGVDEVSINIFSPYPGTEIFRALLAEGRIELGDAYFLKLASLNADYTRLNPLTVNPVMGARELAIWRLSFMLTNYLVGYVVYPGRIVRTLRNVFGRGRTATVFEHRMRDLVRRRLRPAE